MKKKGGKIPKTLNIFFSSVHTHPMGTSLYVVNFFVKELWLLNTLCIKCDTEKNGK